MAAQEYYNPGSTTSHPPGPYQNPHSSAPNNNYPDHAPPPYSAQVQQHLHPQQQPAAPQLQYPANGKQQYYPPQNQRQPQGQYYPQPQGQYYPQQQYPPAQYPQQAGYQNYQQPAAAGTLRPGDYNTSTYQRPQSHSQPPRASSAYPQTYQERSSSRHKQHHHHRHNSGNGASSSKGNKGSIDTFVGAGGGAIIGDMIFPGLGTVGGALLGGLGGHKVAEDKRRRSSDAKYRGASHRSRSAEYYEDDDRRGRY